MTKGKAPGAVCRGVLTWLIPAYFLVGCGTASQPKQAISVVTTTEFTSETEAEPTPPEAPRLVDQSPAVAIDEKRSIFFSLGSSTISQQEKTKLLDVADRLKNDRKVLVRLIGYAKDNGSRSFDLAVADARVASVGSALKALGVKPHQIVKNVTGGEKIPRTCRSAECRRKMRRVELVVSAAP